MLSDGDWITTQTIEYRVEEVEVSPLTTNGLVVKSFVSVDLRVGITKVFLDFLESGVIGHS